MTVEELMRNPYPQLEKAARSSEPVRLVVDGDNDLLLMNFETYRMEREIQEMKIRVLSEELLRLKEDR